MLRGMPQGFFTSTIGQKVLMAVTGVVLFGFVLGHMAGNLQVFLGREAFKRLQRLAASLPPRDGPLDRSPRSPRRRRDSHRRLDLADPEEPARAAGRVPRDRLQPLDLRVADDALERSDHPRLRDLSPARSHARAGEPRIRPHRPVQESRRQFRADAPSSPSTSSRSRGWGCTSAMASGACSNRSACRIRVTTDSATPRRPRSPSSSPLGFIVVPLSVQAGWVR
jgi:hypothetical protein